MRFDLKFDEWYFETHQAMRIWYSGYSFSPDPDVLQLQGSRAKAHFAKVWKTFEI